MGDWITGLIERLGATGVFLLTLLETVFPPIPSELVLPLAGYLSARGMLGLVAVVVAGTLGATAGALVLYLLGLRIGEERLKAFARQHGHWLTVSPRDIDRASRWFSRHGGWAVFGCRMVPGLRSLISLPAGIHAMPLGRFLGCTLAGSAAWTALLVGLGYGLGARFERVGTFVEPVAQGVLVLAAGWYLWRLVRGKGRA